MLQQLRMYVQIVVVDECPNRFCLTRSWARGRACRATSTREGALAPTLRCLPFFASA
jgi:hypothetical protein